MSTKHDHVKLMKDYIARVTRGDLDAIEEFFCPDFHSHVVRRVHPAALGTDIRLCERMFWEESAAAFPDRAFRIEGIWDVPGEQTVVMNYTMTGTHSGSEYFGVPPSGEPVEINGTAIQRFENGKMKEHWGGPHCMHGIGLLATETPKKIAI